jgi:protein-arginine kinase activator protein McsA
LSPNANIKPKAANGNSSTIELSGPQLSPDEKRAHEKFKHVAASLPYKIESNEEMQRRLDVILARLVEAVESRDYEYGLLQWDSMFASYVTYFICIISIL